MTGLDSETDQILQICCFVTDAQLQLLEPNGFETIIHQPKSTLDTMSQWCIDTHGKSGLTDAVLASTTDAATAAAELLAYIKQHVPEQRTAILAGNSVHADRAFLAKGPYAKVLDWLHYRLLDVSTLKEAARRWGSEELLRNAPPKRELHLARDDILESIAEMKYYREKLAQAKIITTDFKVDVTGTAYLSCNKSSQVLYTGHTSHGLPIYPNSNLSNPALRKTNCLSWVDDHTIPPENVSSISIRAQHPKIFAPMYKWHRLPFLIQQDPYLRKWNESIFQQADMYYGMPTVQYLPDGGLNGSGILDCARQIQLRVKHWAYAYRMSNDTRWASRTWEELLVASGNSSQYFGVSGDNWNTQHWLDVGELLTAFAIAYDWLYDIWTNDQRNAIMWSIISLGLNKGYEAYESDMWFLFVEGNWNCVTNAGIITGALAIYNEDPTGIAAKLLELAIPNAQQHCAQAVHSDGTWTETPDYWYFGVQTHAQMSSALLTATGSTHSLLTINPAFKKTPLFHIYALGMTDLFNYGDCGPEKFTATANAMLFYGDQLNKAADPLSMFWYDPQVTGGWYMGLPLDSNFSNTESPWVSMRSSWTDTTGLFVAMKAGPAVGHQTHSNIDAGDFVLDALGERWAGELCQSSYLSTGYFSSESQNSTRWLYYRTRTEGQNTIVYNRSNQIVDAKPSWIRFETTGEAQTGPISQVKKDSATYWIANLTNSYGGVHIERGIRLFNGRSQVLLQDEITEAISPCQWRMHTNATIKYRKGKRVAGLSRHVRLIELGLIVTYLDLFLNGKSLTAKIQSPEGLTFRTVKAARGESSPNLPGGETDPENSGVQVLAVDIPAGTHTIAVIFSPAWDAMFRWLGGVWDTLFALSTAEATLRLFSPLPSGAQTQVSVMSDPVERISLQSRRMEELEKEASALRRELQVTSTPPTTVIRTQDTRDYESTEARSIDALEIGSPIIDHCFRLFFRDYHPLLPVLDPTIMPNNLYGKSPVLFWVVVSIGARKNLAHPNLITALSSRVSPLILTSLSTRTRSLEAIKAMLLLMEWPFPSNPYQGEPSFVLSGALVHMAMQNGLHTPYLSKDVPKLEAQSSFMESSTVERIRLWAYVVIVYQRQDPKSHLGIPNA
ncbi:hypothetical protein PISL3812_03079 [Talaromyces islandicus]|uniref:Exonuclease domain-containing protein n=1 Tax=Talaromyces islandicus TaxID=28573 RepID=A0A0U1LTH8_TALIS|nr:hypothetical protein PISL3812_03079 [Talaromyces islandicus]